MENKIKEMLAGKSLGGSLRIIVSDDCNIAVSQDGEFIDDISHDCDCTITSDKDTFKGLADGTQDPMNAYFSGKLSVKGNLNIAMELTKLF